MVFCSARGPACSLLVFPLHPAPFSDLGVVLAQWVASVGHDVVTARQVMDRASEKLSRQVGSGFRDEFRHPEFHEAMPKATGKGGAINTKSLGWWLPGNMGRIVGGLRNAKVTENDSGAKWRVEKA